jgi:hypothetical protein
MLYREFAVAIGLMSDSEQWQAWHRQQVGDILNLVAATERQAGRNTKLDPLQFRRIVNEDGQPGGGFYKTARIVVKAPG